MVEAAVSAAKVKARAAIDAEIGRWCSANASIDAAIDDEFAQTLGDGLE